MSCEYCGWKVSSTRDHVISISWQGVSRSAQWTNQEVVECCKECNSTLGAVPLFNTNERAAYLYEKYTKKYRKLLRSPKWTDKELEEMSPFLKKTIIATQEHKAFINARMVNLYKLGNHYLK